VETLRHHVLSARSEKMQDGAPWLWTTPRVKSSHMPGTRREQSRRACFVDGIRAMRQVGIHFKTAGLALAFDDRILTPVS